MKRALSKERLAIWLQVYAAELQECVKTMPHEYAYPLAEVPKVLQRMEKAFMTGSYNAYSSPAMDRARKALGIKLTYKALEEYLRPDDCQGPENAHRAVSCQNCGAGDPDPMTGALIPCPEHGGPPYE